MKPCRSYTAILPVVVILLMSCRLSLSVTDNETGDFISNEETSKEKSEVMSSASVPSKSLKHQNPCKVSLKYTLEIKY